jgi:predicted small lipoprotein YifL
MQASVVGSSKLSVIAAALLGLAVAACGRMGPLDLPPGATADQAPNSKRNLAPEANQAAPPAQNPKKSLPIDWLLN